MRRLLVSLVIAAATLLPAVPAAAHTGTAEDFAKDCMDDGFVRVARAHRYIGGSATIDGDCVVAMRPGALLVFRGVSLLVSGNLVAISSREMTTIRVVDSAIEVRGALELTAGCCAGDPTVPEHDGTVIVKNSSLSGSSLQLLASPDWPDGRVIVRNSKLEGTGSLGVQIRASDVAGRRGVVRVVGSFVGSGGDVLIRTGRRGLTVARNDTFAAAGSVTITTGRRGVCRSSGHTPPTACT